MTRLMYDSTNLDDLPADAAMVASYVDGLFAQPPERWARFARAVKVTISVSANTPGAMVYDVETGDLIPAWVPPVLRRERAGGRNPTIYVNRSNVDQVRAECRNAGIIEPPYWLSTLDGTLDWRPGVVAVQTQGARLTGHHWDLSVVADYWPGVDPAPHPVTKEAPRMFLRNPDTGAIYRLGDSIRHIPAAEWPYWAQQGQTFIDVPAAELAKILAG